MRSSKFGLSKRSRWNPPARTTSPVSEEGNATNFQTQRTRPEHVQLNLGPLKKKKKIQIEVEPEEQKTIEPEDITLYPDFQTREKGSQEQFGAGYGHPNFHSRNIR